MQHDSAVKVGAPTARYLPSRQERRSSGVPPKAFQVVAWARSTSRSASSLGLGLAIGLVLALGSLPTADPNPYVVTAQLLCCAGAAIAVRWPLVGSGFLGGLLVILVTVSPGMYLGMGFLAFSVATAMCAVRGHRLAALVFGLWYFALFMAATSVKVSSAGEMARAVNFWLMIIFGPLLLGELLRRLQRRSEKQSLEQVVASERRRQAIARDLHDTLAYATTSVVMKAEQARLRGGQDDQTLADLDYIAATARSATADLRTILAMLRESGRDLDPSRNALAANGMPIPTRLEEVLEAQRAKLAAFDFDVNISLNGDPTTVPDHLFAVLARALTEIASNITKHGDRCCEVSILIDFGGEDIEAVLVNTPRQEPADSGHRGLGLLGLREVVEAEGGSFASGPMGNRWISHVTLPREDEVGV